MGKGEGMLQIRMIPLWRGVFVIALGFLMTPNLAYSQPVWMGLPGAILNPQSMQQRFWRKSAYTTPRTVTPSLREDVIFTDRFKRPITQQEFMRNVQQHHAEIYNADIHEPSKNIEPPPPEDATLQ